MKHSLPSKIISYVRRLEAEYTASFGKSLEREIMATCRVRVEEETDYDNWNGGTYGHDVWFYLPLNVLTRIGLKNLESVRKSILEDLQILARPVANEFFHEVHLEEIDEEDFGCQVAEAMGSRPLLNPDTMPFWKPGMVRLFISHKDKHKAKANALARALEDFGISSFVAHDTIQPMSEWRKEIMKGLETMEIMLVFLTDDFHNSTFTNQEVGYALGANKPIISLKLEKNDPPGFISHEQALRGDIDDAATSAKALYPLLAKAIGKKDRLDDSLISAFVNSTDFNETRDRFDLLSSVVQQLKPHQLDNIIASFQRNDQLHNCIYLANKFERLRRYLEKATGKQFEVDGREIKELAPRSTKPVDDDVPF